MTTKKLKQVLINLGANEDYIASAGLPKAAEWIAARCFVRHFDPTYDSWKMRANEELLRSYLKTLWEKGYYEFD